MSVTHPLSPLDVERILLEVLFNDDELPTEPSLENLPPDAVLVEGIVSSYAFHGERLRAHKEDIKEMLLMLPHGFRQSDPGGGMSFLTACDDENGNQWTGLHLTMGNLFCLGIGLDLVKYLLPREVWGALPGSVPYLVIMDEGEAWTS